MIALSRTQHRVGKLEPPMRKLSAGDRADHITSCRRNSVGRIPSFRTAIIAALLLLVAFTARAGGVVTNCTEAALRGAMSGGGVVTFACEGTIYLSSTITQALATVLNGSAHPVTISGNGAIRLFYVPTNVSFTVIGLTLADGYSKVGSAILNLGGNVSLTGVTFRTNIANPAAPSDGTWDWSAVGGAIFSHGGVLTATNCKFLGNAAFGFPTFLIGAPELQANGGAVCNQSGLATLEGCTLIANRANGGQAFAPQVNGASAGAGAIYNSGTLMVNTCYLAQNSALGGEGYQMYGTAGGSALGGAILNEGTLSLGRTTFAENAVTGGNGGSGYNGGVYMDLGLPGGNGAAGGAGVGGALFNNGTASIVNCTFVANRGRGGNGGAGGRGGGPYVRYGGRGGDGANGGNACGGVAGTCNLTNGTLAWNVGLAGSGGAGGSAGGGTINPGSPGASGSDGSRSGAVACGPLPNTLIVSNTPAYPESFPEPKLGPLADNGGPTLTMALLPGSPAIDTGQTFAGITIDQRGFPRPAGAAVDIGAFEYGSVMPTLALNRSGQTTVTIIASGNTGQLCRLLGSSDFLQWIPLGTNRIGIDGTVLFTDDCGSAACGFYRLVMP